MDPQLVHENVDVCLCGADEGSMWEVNTDAGNADSFLVGPYCRTCVIQAAEEHVAQHNEATRWALSVPISVFRDSNVTEDNVRWAAAAAYESRVGRAIDAADVPEKLIQNYLRHKETNYDDLVRLIPKDAAHATEAYIILKCRYHTELQRLYPEFELAP